MGAGRPSDYEDEDGYDEQGQDPRHPFPPGNLRERQGAGCGNRSRRLSAPQSVVCVVELEVPRQPRSLKPQ